MAEPNYPTLSTIIGRIRKLLAPALDAREFWVMAELSSAKENRGHLYCDLVETKNGRVTAKVRCNVWQRDLETIRNTFESQGLELALEDGTEVGIKCKVEFHEVYGLSLRGVAFDPRVALGAMERRRREMLERLAKDKLLDVNGKLTEPALPNRVGVVASVDTAGYADFIETVRRCEFGVQLFVADARVQGASTEQTVLRALDCLEALDVGLVVIIRGGGSRVDLSHLDNEAIARRIAGFPVPVWTGIGHETDRSVLDEVAARSFKTPTAVAEHISSTLEAAGRTLADASRSLQVAWRQCIEPARHRLATSRALLDRAAEAAISRRRTEFAALAQHLKDASRGRLRAQRLRLYATSREIHATSTGRIRVATQMLEERHKSLHKTTMRRLTAQHADLDAWTKLLGRGAQSATNQKRENLSRTQARFQIERFLDRVNAARDKHRDRERLLRAADPQRALERGYSMTYDADGTLIRSVTEAAKGTKLTTRLGDGSIMSTVDDIEEIQ